MPTFMRIWLIYLSHWKKYFPIIKLYLKFCFPKTLLYLHIHLKYLWQLNRKYNGVFLKSLTSLIFNLFFILIAVSKFSLLINSGIFNTFIIPTEEENKFIWNYMLKKDLINSRNCLCTCLQHITKQIIRAKRDCY